MLTAVWVLATFAQSASPALLLPAYGPADPDTKRAVQSALREKMSAHVKLAPEAETVAQLKGAEQLGMCAPALNHCPECTERDLECIVGLRETAGANISYVLVATPEDNDIILTLAEVNAISKSVKRKARSRLRSLGEDATFEAVQKEQRRAASALVVQIFSPADYAASVDVIGDAGCDAALDGTSVGVLPLPAPLSGVAPGPHTVSLTCRANGAINKTAYVVYGDVTTFDFSPEGTTPVAPPAETEAAVPNVAVVAGGAAGMALGAVVMIGAVGIYLLAVSGAAQSPDGGLKDQVASANQLYGVSLGVAALGAVIVAAGAAVAGVGGVLMGME